MQEVIYDIDSKGYIRSTNPVINQSNQTHAKEEAMRKLLVLLSVFFLMFAPYLLAQTTLDPSQYVNTQIAADTLADGSHDPAKTVYKAESGQFYAFDGTLVCDFDLVIEGPDNTWIKNQTSPPVFLQIPASDGTARDMINVKAGGSTRIKNIIMDGNLSNGEIVGAFVVNSGGYKVIFDNCALSCCKYFTSRNQAVVDTLSYTNCLFINMVRKASTPFNGMLMRIDAACTNFIFENNTSVNSSRLFGNGGNFFTSKELEVHNTYLNMQVNGHELHWYEALQANNIYYNWSYRGRTLATNHYEAPFTTWDHYYQVENKLDSISLYQGHNAFYLDPAFPEYWNNTLNPAITDDSAKIIPCFLWDRGVDTTMTNDDNFTVGKNYWQFDPMFTSDPSKVDSMLAWDNYYWNAGTNWPDWRAPLVVDFDSDGQPILNWPPTFNLSYTNDTLLTAGTDGLPLGDLNWFPNAKVTYEANKAQYIAALRDSMTNATYVYIPGDSLSAFITSDDITAVESDNSEIPSQYYLSNNYPNPFNPTTKITFGLPVQSAVTLSVYNILGQKVFETTEKDLSSGVHSLNFDASNLSSGVYVYSIRAVGANGRNFVSSKKMMLLK